MARISLFLAAMAALVAVGACGAAETVRSDADAGVYLVIKDGDVAGYDCPYES